jgi:subtilisin-like proprotein convertase family protein
MMNQVIAGTRSTLLAKRARDTSRTGFRDWAFMTTHDWGEPAHGTGLLEIDNDGWDDAELLKWDLGECYCSTLAGF